MPILVLLAHHTPAILPAYRAALSASGIADDLVELRPFVSPFPGMSSAYTALANHLREGGRILPGLLRHAGATLPLSSYDAVLLVTWSAPYSLMESVLAIAADRDAIAGWIGCDSGYGIAPPSIVDWARLARDSRKLYSAIYTDVPTYTYPSSGDFLAQVQREAGAPAGMFTVEHRAHDVTALHTILAGLTGAARGQAEARYWEHEHVAARDEGPRLLVAAMAALGLTVVPDAEAVDPVAPTQRTGFTIPPPRAEAPTLGDEPRSLRRGDKGTDVMDLQIQLTRLGSRIACDGSFGPMTESAVRAFQIRASVGADGVVDSATRRALDAAIASLRGKGAAPVDAVATGASSTIGQRALAVAIGELGTHEVAGPGANPRIVQYLAGCERSGHPLGLTGDEPAWCAALKGFCEHAAA